MALATPSAKIATAFALSLKMAPTQDCTIFTANASNHVIRSELRISPKLHSFDSRKLHLSTKYKSIGALKSIKQFNRPQSSSFICAAASATQTLPQVEKPKTTHAAPKKDKTTFTPKLDDSGPSLPPWFNGGGGGGGGGGDSSGGFFLFGFLLILSYLKDEEERLIKMKKDREFLGDVY